MVRCLFKFRKLFSFFSKRWVNHCLGCYTSKCNYFFFLYLSIATRQFLIGKISQFGKIHTQFSKPDEALHSLRWSADDSKLLCCCSHYIFLWHIADDKVDKCTLNYPLLYNEIQTVRIIYSSCFFLLEYLLCVLIGSMV